MFSCLNVTQFATLIITAVIPPTCSVPEVTGTRISLFKPKATGCLLAEAGYKEQRNHL